MTATLPRVPVTDPPAKLPEDMVLPPLASRNTAEGPAAFRSVRVPMWCQDDFWNTFNANKLRFLRRGFSVRNEDGKWILQQWLRVADGWTLTRIGAEILERVMGSRPTAGGAPEEPELVLEPLPSFLESRLWDYQITPARQISRALRCGWAEWKYPGTFDGSDLGTGKSYVTTAVAAATGRKIITLCPLAGHEGWSGVFDHFQTRPHYLGTYEGLRNGNREAIVKLREDGTFEWKQPDEVLLVLDEGQAVRHSSLTTQMCAGAVRQGIPIIIASATIALDPREMRFMGRVTGLHQGGDDFLRFLAANGCERKAKSKEWTWSGDRRHLTNINRTLFPRRGARVSREDLGDKFPETTIKVLPIHCREGRDIEERWRQALAAIRAVKASDPGKAQVMRQRLYQPIWQACELALVPHITALAKADIANGRSVALFVCYDETRKRLCEAMGTTAGFYGGMRPEARAQYIREFQSNRIHCLISNIKAGGASVSLHDIHGERPRTSYIFPTDNIVAFTQSTGRVHRAGGKSPSLQFIPCLKGTLTEAMVSSMREKMLNLSAVHDGKWKGQEQF